MPLQDLRSPENAEEKVQLVRRRCAGLIALGRTVRCTGECRSAAHTRLSLSLVLPQDRLEVAEARRGGLMFARQLLDPSCVFVMHCGPEVSPSWGLMMNSEILR